MPTPEFPVSISVGETRLSGIYARPGNPFATLVVAHGAGTGMDHPFLAGFTRTLNDASVATLRFNFPYREAGRKFPDRPQAGPGVFWAQHFREFFHAGLSAGSVQP